MHPNKGSAVVEIKFSPDGKRIIAGDYPGGVVQLWDVATGKQLTKIDTGYGYHGSYAYFQVAPDWKSVFGSHSKQKIKHIDKEGKKFYDLHYEGEIRAWSLDTGKIVKTYKHDPQRYVTALTLSPDGQSVLAVEELSGVYEKPSAKRVLSLWDAKTGEFQSLPYDELGWPDRFSPDGKMVVFSPRNPGHGTNALKLIDAASFKEILTIPVAQKNYWARIYAMTPDGKQLIGQIRAMEDKKWKDYLKFWDAKTGKELASFTNPDKAGFGLQHLSPDGSALAVANWLDKTPKLFFFDVAGQKLLRSTVLTQKGNIGDVVFSPNGKWIAVSTQHVPEELGLEPDAEDVPQPRIQLVEVATGTVRETIISPQGYAGSLCFSPDGKTLASSGHGRVLLWDVSDLKAGVK